jgi:hypothetical protein
LDDGEKHIAEPVFPISKILPFTKGLFFNANIHKSTYLVYFFPVQAEKITVRAAKVAIGLDLECFRRKTCYYRSVRRYLATRARVRVTPRKRVESPSFFRAIPSTNIRFIPILSP